MVKLTVEPLLEGRLIEQLLFPPVGAVFCALQMALLPLLGLSVMANVGATLVLLTQAYSNRKYGSLHSMQLVTVLPFTKLVVHVRQFYTHCVQELLPLLLVSPNPAGQALQAKFERVK